MKLNRYEWAVIALMGVACAMRFWNIGFQHPNYDENFTLAFASPTLTAMQIIINSMTIDYTPPLFYLAAHFSMLVFGPTLDAARYPSAICGVLLIPMMFFIGKEYRDELFGILLAGFTTFYYNAFFYSRYARSYSMDLLFFSAAFYFYMKALKGDNRSGAFFGLFAVLSMWTHLYSAIPIGAMCLYLLWKRAALGGVGIVILGGLPLMQYINVILETRCTAGATCYFTGTNSFGATPAEILYLTPLDIFAYSAVIVVPVIVWSLWKHRNEEIIKVIVGISVLTWISMFVLSMKTPIIVHYAIFLVPMLLLAFILPFYEAIRSRCVCFYHAITAFIILLMEFFQMFLLYTTQRGGF